MRTVVGLALVGALVASGAAQAVGPLEQDPHQLRREYEEAAPWKEGSHAIPPLPAADALATVDVAPPGTPFTVALDTQHLSVGEDGVVRYSVVLTSASGTRNLFFEGMRCSVPAYITYAFSSGEGKAFEPMTEPQWQPLPSRGTGAFRVPLRLDYFCDKAMEPRPLAEIRERIQYPPRDSRTRLESILVR